MPLPLLKEKFEQCSKILKVITELLKIIDYNTENGKELASILNDTGIILSEGNLARTSDEALQKYYVVQAVFESFVEI